MIVVVNVIVLVIDVVIYSTGYGENNRSGYSSGNRSSFQKN